MKLYEASIRAIRFTVAFAIAIATAGLLAAKADSVAVSEMKLDRMPESLETRYALSAVPPHLRDATTVYLLDPDRGYYVSRKGTNGISCLVIRADWQFPTRSFQNDVYWPVGFDAGGTKTLMQDFLTAAEMRAHGADSKNVYLEIIGKFGRPGYPNPTRSNVA
jgi:hypothetical protein